MKLYIQNLFTKMEEKTVTSNGIETKTHLNINKNEIPNRIKGYQEQED